MNEGMSCDRLTSYQCDFSFASLGRRQNQSNRKRDYDNFIPICLTLNADLCHIF